MIIHIKLSIKLSGLGRRNGFFHAIRLSLNTLCCDLQEYQKRAATFYLPPLGEIRPSACEKKTVQPPRQRWKACGEGGEGASGWCS